MADIVESYKVLLFYFQRQPCYFLVLLLLPFMALAVLHSGIDPTSSFGKWIKIILMGSEVILALGFLFYLGLVPIGLGGLKEAPVLIYFSLALGTGTLAALYYCPAQSFVPSLLIGVMLVVFLWSLFPIERLSYRNNIMASDTVETLLEKRLDSWNLRTRTTVIDQLQGGDVMANGYTQLHENARKTSTVRFSQGPFSEAQISPVRVAERTISVDIIFRTPAGGTSLQQASQSVSDWVAGSRSQTLAKKWKSFNQDISCVAILAPHATIPTIHQMACTIDYHSDSKLEQDKFEAAVFEKE